MAGEALLQQQQQEQLYPWEVVPHIQVYLAGVVPSKSALEQQKSAVHAVQQALLSFRNVHNVFKGGSAGKKTQLADADVDLVVLLNRFQPHQTTDLLKEMCTHLEAKLGIQPTVRRHRLQLSLNGTRMDVLLGTHLPSAAVAVGAGAGAGAAVGASANSSGSSSSSSSMMSSDGSIGALFCRMAVDERKQWQASCSVKQVQFFDTKAKAYSGLRNGVLLAKSWLQETAQRAPCGNIARPKSWLVELIAVFAADGIHSQQQQQRQPERDQEDEQHGLRHEQQQLLWLHDPAPLPPHLPHNCSNSGGSSNSSRSVNAFNTKDGGRCGSDSSGVAMGYGRSNSEALPLPSQVVSSQSAVAVFAAFLHAVQRIAQRDVQVVWVHPSGLFYSEKHAQMAASDAKAHGVPCVLDPVDPTNNVASTLTAEGWQQFATAASAMEQRMRSPSHAGKYGKLAGSEVGHVQGDTVLLTNRLHSANTWADVGAAGGTVAVRNAAMLVHEHCQRHRLALHPTFTIASSQVSHSGTEFQCCLVLSCTSCGWRWQCTGPSALSKQAAKISASQQVLHEPRIWHHCVRRLSQRSPSLSSSAPFLHHNAVPAASSCDSSITTATPTTMSSSNNINSSISICEGSRSNSSNSVKGARENANSMGSASGSTVATVSSTLNRPPSTAENGTESGTTQPGATTHNLPPSQVHEAAYVPSKPSSSEHAWTGMDLLGMGSKLLTEMWGAWDVVVL